MKVRDYKTGLSPGAISSGTYGIGNSAVGKAAVRLPKHFVLEQNYPNPFNPVTTIRYGLIKDGHQVRLKIHDMRGREIMDLVNTEQQAGWYQVSFDAAALPSGIYVYSLQTDGFYDVKKMILLK